MLLSMTGFGEARLDSRSNGPISAAAVEIRSINNRYLKITSKIPDGYFAIEHDIESAIREAASRGTFNVTVKVERGEEQTRYEINQAELRSYRKQLPDSLGNDESSALAALLQLPGVVREAEREPAAEERELILDAVRAAMTKLQEFRAAEGGKMAADLEKQSAIIAENLKTVIARAPQVVEEYRDRLKQRLTELLAASEAEFSDSDIIREVSIFAERCDINEEITRLQSHLEHFAEFLAGEESLGRKLEFLGQEMFREINTIGSKANDVSIAHAVVEMKGCIEKIREILQNVE